MELQQNHGRCKVNRFYIKPQLMADTLIAECVVKLIDSTSNHNRFLLRRYCLVL